MDIVILFPKQFFTTEQLKKLNKCNLKFIEGKNLDLDKLKDLYSSKELILAIDPTYSKDGWDSLTVERVKRMSGLKALCLTTTSFSWVDLETMKKLGIIVTNTPGKSTEAVAEFNIYMMLSLLRKTPLIIKNKWNMDYDNFTNDEAKGKTAGIIGLGKIGQRVGELCQGMGMNVIYWNRSKKTSTFKSVTLDKLFANSDVVFNTIATAPELKGFINKKLLSKLKSTAVICSTSDTHVLDTDFIFKQVKDNKLGGYAFENTEQKVADFEGNVMVFPEQAYFTLGTLQNTARILTDTVLSIINKKPINKVN